MFINIFKPIFFLMFRNMKNRNLLKRSM